MTSKWLINTLREAVDKDPSRPPVRRVRIILGSNGMPGDVLVQWLDTMELEWIGASRLIAYPDDKIEPGSYPKAHDPRAP